MSACHDWIGRTHTLSDVLTPAMLNRFRATIDSAETGDLAPQGIHWCLCTPEAATAVLGEDGHPRRDSVASFLPAIPLPRRMWASSACSFHAPIRSGAQVSRTSMIADIAQKSGSSGALVFVHLDHTVTADGALAVHERQTLVYREAGVQSGPSARSTNTPVLELAAWNHHRSVTPTPPLLFRYSALTFNSHRIHYDAPYARDVEGYAGLVVHGPLTATLLLDLAAREYGPNRLRSFSFRGVSPGFTDEPLHLVMRRAQYVLTLAALTNDGRIIMQAEGHFPAEHPSR